MIVSKSSHLIRPRGQSNNSSARAAHYPIEFSIGHSATDKQIPAVKMERVIIIGSSGSGKSTLARKLGQKTGLPVIHLDKYFWNPGWVETAVPIWQQTLQELVQQPRWIIDGNYRQSLTPRLQAADTVIFLDLPRWLSAWQAIGRRLRYRRRPRPDMAPGCQETLFSPDFPDFLIRIWQYPYRARPDVQQRLAQLDSDKRIVHLRSRADMRRFLADPEGYTGSAPQQLASDF